MRPQNPFNIALQLHHSGRLREAIDVYGKLLISQSKNAQLWYLIGTANLQLKQYEQGFEQLKRALSLDPKNPPAYKNRATAFRELGLFDEALADFDTAISLNPNYAEAHNDRGVLLKYLNRIDESIASFDKALAVNPKFADAYFNKATALILTGSFSEGWALFEWRLRMSDVRKNYYKFPQPAWRGGEYIQAKKLFIHSEQGFGDVVQFCRYLPKIDSLGAEVIFEVPGALASLISSLKCPMTVVPKGAELPKFDAYCPVMSLPYVFKTTLTTIPAANPYLFSDQQKTKIWQEKLGDKKKFRIGLVWSGSTEHTEDAYRSISLEELLPLIDLPIEWHSLHKEYRQHDLEVLRQNIAIQQHQDDLKDFSDTAALIECMDLVISVDTSVAHVAGAIGKPVWILLPFAPDYRWMLDIEDSPWYPSARLFRQSASGDWRSVITAVIRELIG